jgi:DsbC/DsbD-like thiol-disulfide interchange protein
LPTVAVYQSPAEEHVALELVCEEDALVAGKELWLGIRFSLKDGFNTYWTNPGDSGEPPRIEWQLPSELKASAIQWPQPTRLMNPPFADYGYEHEVLLMTVISAPRGLATGQNVNLGAKVHYLICREVCIPGGKQLNLRLPVKDRASKSAASRLFDVTRRRLPHPLPAQWQLTATEGTAELILNLTAKDAPPSSQFFPLNPEQIENGAPQKVTAKPDGIRLHLIKSKHLLKPATRLKGVLVVGSGRAYLVNIPISRPGRQDSSRSKAVQ